MLVLTHLPCVTGMWLRAAEWSHYREATRKNPTAVEHKGQSTGGRTEQASNIARGTPGSSVTCGIALSDSISCERCRPAPEPRGFGVRGSRNDPASRAPPCFGDAQTVTENYGAPAPQRTGPMTRACCVSVVDRSPQRIRRQIVDLRCHCEERSDKATFSRTPAIDFRNTGLASSPFRLLAMTA